MKRGDRPVFVIEVAYASGTFSLRERPVGSTSKRVTDEYVLEEIVDRLKKSTDDLTQGRRILFADSHPFGKIHKAMERFTSDQHKRRVFINAVFFAPLDDWPDSMMYFIAQNIEEEVADWLINTRGLNLQPHQIVVVVTRGNPAAWSDGTSMEIEME